MIAVSVILVALVSSVVIGVVVVLLASAMVRLTKSIVRRVRGHPLRRGAATERWIGTGPLSGDGEGDAAVSIPRTGWMVGCLLAAAVLGLVGMFLPLHRFHFPGHSGSISLYSSMPYGAITSWLGLAVLVILGYLVVRRRDRIAAALIVGYCASNLGSFVSFVAGFTVKHAQFAPAYYVLGAGYCAQVVAFVIAGGILVAGLSDRGVGTVRGVWLGVLAALLGAAASPLYPVKGFGMSIWSWNGLPWQDTIGLVAGLLVVVLIPLVALRIADRAAACMVLGLGAAIALSATEALLQKLSQPSLFQLTLGFWLTTFGVVTLVSLAFALTKPFAERPASTPIPVSVT